MKVFDAWRTWTDTEPPLRVPQFVSLFAQWQQHNSRLADEQERTSHA